MKRGRKSNAQKELELATRLCYEAQKRAFLAPDDERARRTYQNALLRLKDAEKALGEKTGKKGGGLGVVCASTCLRHDGTGNDKKR